MSQWQVDLISSGQTVVDAMGADVLPGGSLILTDGAAVTIAIYPPGEWRSARRLPADGAKS